MQTKTLKIFCDLAETKSFSKTAQINNLSQPAITQQIKTLEQELNVNLVDKESKIFKLTPHGEIVLTYAKTILAEYYSLKEKIKSGTSIHDTQLSIGTSYFVGFYIFAKYLKLILQKITKTNINLQYINNYSQFENSNNVNLIISEQQFSHPDFVSGMLAYDELVLISATTNEDNVANLEKSQSIQSLRDAYIIGFTKDNAIRKYLDNETQKHAIFLKYAKEFDNIELVKQMVLANNGMAIVPISCILHDEQYLFNVTKFSDISLKLPIYYAYNPVDLSKQSELLQQLFKTKHLNKEIDFCATKHKTCRKKKQHVLDQKH